MRNHHGFPRHYPLSINKSLHSQPLVSVEVLDPPSNGHEVGAQMKINGTAHLPRGNYLWVFVHRIKGFENKWWPQGVVKINQKTQRGPKPYGLAKN